MLGDTMTSFLATSGTGLTETRRRARSVAPQSESLLQIPLVRQAFCDLNFQLVERGVDANWRYEKAVPISVTGFNPFRGAYYYGGDSCFSKWLADPFASARELNESDLLSKEVLFMTHDYLHAWTYQAIDRLRPESHVLDGPITPETFEDFVFCHLITEAAATVGLDYWCLSERSVNDYCPIGSGMGPLTVSYREARLPEYRRFYPKLEVQVPEFFEIIAMFYCTGEFPGFDADDMRRSPLLLAWLRHELSYGATQRALTRQWLAYLSEEEIDLPEARLTDPVAVKKETWRSLLPELGRLLGEKVKGSGLPETGAGMEEWSVSAGRASPVRRRPDFRFLNLAHVPAEEWRSLGPTRDNFRFWLSQYLCRIPFCSVPRRQLKHIPTMLEREDMNLALDLFGSLPRLQPLPEEPRDLLLAN
jgi:hypothetical protein